MLDLRESWRIGPVEIPSRLVLAPMAGVSVQAFRRQGRRFGAGLVCSEMVSCAGIEHRNERTLDYSYGPRRAPGCRAKGSWSVDYIRRQSTGLRVLSPSFRLPFKRRLAGVALAKRGLTRGIAGSPYWK